jgi:hypothetical protein
VKSPQRKPCSKQNFHAPHGRAKSSMRVGTAAGTAEGDSLRFLDGALELHGNCTSAPASGDQVHALPGRLLAIDTRINSPCEPFLNPVNVPHHRDESLYESPSLIHNTIIITSKYMRNKAIILS